MHETQLQDVTQARKATKQITTSTAKGIRGRNPGKLLKINM